jgi:hypothetical protein
MRRCEQKWSRQPTRDSASDLFVEIVMSQVTKLFVPSFGLRDYARMLTLQIRERRDRIAALAMLSAEHIILTA